MQIRTAQFRSLLIFLWLGCQIPGWGQSPNIILIVTDDQRWDALGYAGNDIIHTPHMDQMAEEGVYFPNAFVTTPICAASRASIMTGTYERTHQFTFGTPPLKKDLINISYPQQLKRAGYYQGFFGKFGMSFEDQLDTLLFDELWTARTEGYFRLQGPGGRDHVHLTDLTTDKALDFIRGAPQNRPFCLSISYNAAHADDSSPAQYFWPKRHDKLYSDVDIPPPPLGDPEYLEKLPDFIRDSLNMSRIRWKWRFDTPEKYQQMVKGYYRMVTTVDDNLGRIRRTLDELSLTRNTVIIFIGDNGYFLGERGLAGKWYMYDNSLRVPLIIYDPRPEKFNPTPTQMALNIDIAPTILDLAGVAIPQRMQGESLMPLIRGEKTDWRTEFLCEHLFNLEYIPKSEGIRTENWKYFRYIDHPEVEELYDLEQDPRETVNLVKDAHRTAELERLRKQCDDYIAQASKN